MSAVHGFADTLDDIHSRGFHEALGHAEVPLLRSVQKDCRAHPKGAQTCNKGVYDRSKQSEKEGRDVHMTCRTFGNRVEFEISHQSSIPRFTPASGTRLLLSVKIGTAGRHIGIQLRAYPVAPLVRHLGP
jgi:hypothetical protein